MKNNHGRFSKRVLVAMMILWFATAGYGFVVETILLIIRPELINLGELFAFVGLPIGGGVTTYYIKSALENSKKIEKGSEEPDPEEPEAADVDIFENDELLDGFNDIEVDSDEY